MYKCYVFSCLGNCDTFQLSFSVFLTLVSILFTILFTILTYYIIYSLKPKLKIVCAYLEKHSDKIKITVENLGRYNAVNLRIEACAFDIDNKFTFHLKIDHNEFLILPGTKKNQDNTKKFKVIGIAESARDYIDVSIIDEETKETKEANDIRKYLKLLECLEKGKYQLRVRIHSYHEFSGLGKAEEKSFRL